LNDGIIQKIRELANGNEDIEQELILLCLENKAPDLNRLLIEARRRVYQGTYGQVSLQEPIFDDGRETKSDRIASPEIPDEISPIEFHNHTWKHIKFTQASNIRVEPDVKLLLMKKYPDIPLRLALRRALGMPVPKDNHWTPEEDGILRRYYPHGGSESCRPFLSRSRCAIQQRANSLGITLKDSFPELSDWMGVAQTAKFLGKSKGYVRHLCSQEVLAFRWGQVGQTKVKVVNAESARFLKTHPLKRVPRKRPFKVIQYLNKKHFVFSIEDGVFVKLWCRRGQYPLNAGTLVGCSSRGIPRYEIRYARGLPTCKVCLMALGLDKPQTK